MPGVKLTVRPEWAWGPATAQPVPPAGIPFVLVAAMQSTVDPSTPFASIGYNQGEAATFDECATLVQDEQTVTSWSVQFNTALSGSQTISFAIVIDGVVDATMPISLAVGDTGGVADGSLVIPAGSLVAIQATLGGGLASKGVRGFVLALNGTPFVVNSFRIPAAASSVAIMGNANFGAAGGGDFEQIAALAPTVGGSIHPLPDNVLIDGVAIHTESVPASDVDFDIIVASGGATLDTVTLPSGDQSVAADVVGVLWPEHAVDADCNDAMAFFSPETGVINNARTQIATRYVPSVPYELYSIILCGLNAGLMSFGAAPEVEPFNLQPGGDTGTDVGVTPSVALRWPTLPGTFQYLVGYAKGSNAAFTTQVDTELQIDGSVVISASSPTGITNPIYARNDIDTAHVDGGELVQFLVTGNSEQMNIRYGACVGFLPD